MMRAGDAHAAMRDLPFRSLEQILAGDLPLILAPHADDESLGCGGLIAACCAAGRTPAVLLLTDGAMSHPNSRTHPASVLRALREREMREATTLLGVPGNRLGFLRLQDAAAPVSGPAFLQAAEAIAAFAQAQGCRLLLAPWRHDPHCDHEAADMMARQAAANGGLRHLAYPVWGWTLPADTLLPTGITGCRLDITPHLALKRRAIAAHASQYGGVILDDPEGFSLPPALLEAFAVPWEVLLEP